MYKGFSRLRRASFLNRKIRTSSTRSLPTTGVKLIFTPFVVLLVLLSTAPMASSQPTKVDTAALIAEAKSFWKRNDQEKALVAIQKAISADPRNPAA
jgi:Tfp pilus assembly protein PilF